MLKVANRGAVGTRILVVGECPDLDSEVDGQAFAGGTGYALRKMLEEGGIAHDECCFTYVVKYRPALDNVEKWSVEKRSAGEKAGFEEHKGRWNHPLVAEGLAELEALVEEMQPSLIVGLGNVALWAFTGQWGIAKWRGSEMSYKGIPFVPTIAPAAVQKNWQYRTYVINDLQKRAVKLLRNGLKVPDFKFHLFPKFEEVMAFLWYLDGPTAWDIETSQGKLVCVGIAVSETEAMCIPFHGPNGPYWTLPQWQAIVAKFKQLREEKRIGVIGQNWNYDAQYFESDFGLTFLADFDTLIAQTVLFPGTERSLAYLSSIYCDYHLYWKDDGKEWKTGIKDFEKEFRYNCRDACATWEVAHKQGLMEDAARLTPQMQERIRYSKSVWKMHRNGVNRDAGRVRKMKAEIDDAVAQRMKDIEEAAGKPVNFASSKQVCDLFYKQWKCPVPANRGKVSADDETLSKVAERNPQHVATALAILECRSLSNVKSNFLEALSDPDGRFRSSWMPTGTETFRLTSSGNAHHRGGNLQNVTKGNESGKGRPMPNLRKTIVPDKGYTMFNCDLERADLQVVIWEANDVEMMQQLREHVDIHTENAKALFGLEKVEDQQRQFGKTFVHLTNYGGMARTCAIKVACTVHQAEKMQKRWFEAHPGIKAWHQRTAAYLQGTRTVMNKFGYRRVYFERIDGLLPQALAWVPQSTVSILISLQQMAMEDACPEVMMLMQGHDSVIGQYPTAVEEDVLRRMQEASRIAVPYDEPLYIPLELATSTDSWGAVKKRDWPTTP